MIKKYLIFVFVTIFIFSTATANVVYSHSSGVSYEEIKDGYKIDVGHAEFIYDQEPERFDFSIFPESVTSTEGELFSDVWVTFMKDKKLFFAGGIHKPVFGSTGLTYVFPEPGTYTMSVRFQKDAETVVKTEFPIEVVPLSEPKETNNVFMYLLFLAAGLCVGVSIGLFIPRKSKQT